MIHITNPAAEHEMALPDADVNQKLESGTRRKRSSFNGVFGPPPPARRGGTMRKALAGLLLLAGLAVVRPVPRLLRAALLRGPLLAYRQDDDDQGCLTKLFRSRRSVTALARKMIGSGLGEEADVMAGRTRKSRPRHSRLDSPMQREEVHPPREIQAVDDESATATNGMGRDAAQGPGSVGHHAIAVRAYEIYLAQGGNDVDNWLTAERELQSLLNSQS